MLDNPYYKSLDGVKEYFDDDTALAILLREGVLFSNCRKYVDIKLVKDDSEQGFHCDDGNVADETIVLFVNCNDCFYWGTADAESLKSDEVQELYNMWKKDGRWGSDKWCCKKRNLQPQVPVKEMMKTDGVWEDWMDKLPEPEPS